MSRRDRPARVAAKPALTTLEGRRLLTAGATTRLVSPPIIMAIPEPSTSFVRTIAPAEIKAGAAPVVVHFVAAPAAATRSASSPATVTRTFSPITAAASHPAAATSGLSVTRSFGPVTRSAATAARVV